MYLTRYFNKLSLAYNAAVTLRLLQRGYTHAYVYHIHLKSVCYNACDYWCMGISDETFCLYGKLNKYKWQYRTYDIDSSSNEYYRLYRKFMEYCKFHSYIWNL